MDEYQSLRELLFDVKRSIEEGRYAPEWVRAEISEIRENGGHCYLKLVEKAEGDRDVVAVCDATIWASDYRTIKPYFFETAGSDLAVGMKILVSVNVSFHERYGFRLYIKDIDPSFTLGDLARRRIQTINQLKEDGVFDMNREVALSDIPRRLAVISAAGAAGYGDFCNQLENNDAGYKFYPVLFPAVMQGDNAPESIISALDRILSYEDFFDAVAIIRGGGASIDLLAFDDYELCSVVAQFPLPVISGVGHERDVSVLDMVANTRCKTPTAVASFLINKLSATDMTLDNLANSLLNNSSRIMSNARIRFENVQNALPNVVRLFMKREESALDSLLHDLERNTSGKIKDGFHQIENIKNMLLLHSKRVFEVQNMKLEKFEYKLTMSSPDEMLKRGFSLTMHNGKIVKDLSVLSVGDKVKTILHNGEIESEVLSKDIYGKQD